MVAIPLSQATSWWHFLSDLGMGLWIKKRRKNVTKWNCRNDKNLSWAVNSASIKFWTWVVNVPRNMPWQIQRNAWLQVGEKSCDTNSSNFLNFFFLSEGRWRRRRETTTTSLIIVLFLYRPGESLLPSISIFPEIIRREESPVPSSICCRTWDIIFGFNFQLAKRALIANVCNYHTSRGPPQIHSVLIRFSSAAAYLLAIFEVPPRKSAKHVCPCGWWLWAKIRAPVED